jgi:hypothetical protein
MGDGSGKETLQSRLRKDDKELWSIIKELADTPELDRRRILRVHAEAGFDQEREAESIQQRSRFDAALGALTVLEIAYQVKIVTQAEQPAPELEDLTKLFASQAVLRYVNAYLYFGIRFLAGRVAAPDWMTAATPPQPATRDSNDRPLCLTTPPDPVAPTSIDAGFTSLFDLAKSTDCFQTSTAAQSPEAKALNFLDDFVTDSEEPDQFELWLQGLRPETDPKTAERFSDLSLGLQNWALARSKLYMSLEPPSSTPPAAADGVQPLNEEASEKRKRPVGGWIVTNPLAARFGLADVYWIARLLRADVSANASVTYTRANWLHLLRVQVSLREDAELYESLRKAEEVLRSVFDFVCDLVQNAVELTDEKELLAYQPELRISFPPQTVKWRKAFDEELVEIDQQRHRRLFKKSSLPGDGAPPPNGPTDDDRNSGDGWMQRLRTGKQPSNLIGLAFSGGGIRSATFNLGVLQGLQEFDLLRQLDFLSTVSGGGFIGSWLVANVCRTKHWLGRLTNWDHSIAHLRRYSNYLAPRTGVMSADTWSMWTSWARNAFLIQLTGVAWLFALLLVALIGERGFTKVGALKSVLCVKVDAGAIAAWMTALVLAILLYNLTGKRAVIGPGATPGAWVRRLGVLPAWIASFLLASLLWANATGRSDVSHAFSKYEYFAILRNAWYSWKSPLGVMWAALVAIAIFTLRTRVRKALWIWHALWISSLCILALYLELCGIMRLFVVWSAAAQNYLPVPHTQFDGYAFVVGPPLVLVANTISVVLFIGFCGRNSNESVREWWTRFGAWLGIYGLGYLAIVTAAVFAPAWTLFLLGAGWRGIKLSAIVSWIGTIIGGLLAGKSSKTSGIGSKEKFPGLEILAKLGGFLFIVAALLVASTVLSALLVNIGTENSNLSDYSNALPEIRFWTIMAVLGVSVLCGSLFSWFFEINIFGLNQFYRSRLARCYLGATRWAPGFRQPQPFTKFDGEDDMRLSDLAVDFRGPFPIFNCALNLAGSSDLALHTRHSASFSLTPLRSGADRRRVGYAPTNLRSSGQFANGVMLGQAVAVSGAAASPNMGYNTSPLVAFLLTMFNVRLGWWFPNPGQGAWDRPGMQFSLYYLIRELFGIADEKNCFVNVSDGGHFENLGIYELVRRRCKVIIASDSECDESLHFGSLGNLVRICETDFGARIDIDVNAIRQQKDGFSLAHCSVGKITYSNGSTGYLIYLKASVSGDEDVGVTQYRSAHPSFPHETTADQFFSEDQFESYRKLGQHVVRTSLRGNQPGDHPVAIAEKLADVLAPAGCSSEAFLKHTKTLNDIWERFRQSPTLQPFIDELMRDTVTPPWVDPAQQNQEMLIGLELIQLMQDVFLDLRLDDFWDHPDNRGWAILFMRWARSPRFRAIWLQVRSTFGIRFEYLCEARLGLPREERTVRV